MKTVDLSKNRLSVDELLDSARHESVMVKSADGATFLLSGADELVSEVELLRRNHRFLELLDKWKQDHRTVTLEQVEDRLQARQT